MMEVSLFGYGIYSSTDAHCASARLMTWLNKFTLPIMVLERSQFDGGENVEHNSACFMGISRIFAMQA